VHEIEGCRIWKFSLAGEPILTLGSGQPGFQKGTVPFESVLFNWIYDLRLGPDGDIYVLDSKNFCVRRIDVRQEMVSPVAGTGRPGYSGDGGLLLLPLWGAIQASISTGLFPCHSMRREYLYCDTYNHVVRMVERATGQISTIAGSI